LDKAIESIGSEGRVVFGGFRVNTDGTQGLDSAIFLKVSDHDDSAELKNLVLRGEGTSQKLSNDGYTASTNLIEKAIRFCEMRDIARLEIELPQTEHAFVSIFLQKGFRILSQRERYHPGQSVCILEKVIGETYYGDPFDRIQLGTWLLHSLLPCRVEHWRSFDRQLEVLTYIPFEIFPVHPAFSNSNPVGHQRRLKGGLFVLDEFECEPRYFERLEQIEFAADNHINYLMADRLSQEERDRMHARGLICFDRNEVRVIAGGENSSLRIPIQQSQVAGVLTVLEERRVKEYANFDSQFVYFLLGRIGKSLPVTSPDGPNDPSSILAVHCPNWGHGRPAIVGFAEVIEKTTLTIADAYDFYGDNVPRALSREDLESYAIRGDEEKIVELLCSKLTLFDEPLHYDDALWSDHSDMQSYIVKELEHANSSYLGRDLCESLRGMAAVPNDEPITVKRVVSAEAPSNADIVVIVMREDEQSAVLSRLPNAYAVRRKRGAYMFGVVTADSGETYRVAVVRTHGQGPGEAQKAASNAIDDLHPQWLALVGIAGGVPDDEFTLGDVVVASRVHDFSVSAAIESPTGEHSTQYQLRGGPIHPVIGDLIGIMPSILGNAPDWNSPGSVRSDRPALDLSSENFYGSPEWRSRTIKSLSGVPRSRSIVTGRSVGTSGVLMKDTEALIGFLNHSRDVAHVEMELGGVYNAALTADNFYPILAVRGLSDIVGFKRSPAWTAYASNIAAAAFFTLLKGLPKGFLKPSE
jgi:nucleoside phosphorylase